MFPNTSILHAGIIMFFTCFFFAQKVIKRRKRILFTPDFFLKLRNATAFLVIFTVFVFLPIEKFWLRKWHLWRHLLPESVRKWRHVIARVPHSSQTCTEKRFLNKRLVFLPIIGFFFHLLEFLMKHSSNCSNTLGSRLIPCILLLCLWQLQL